MPGSKLRVLVTGATGTQGNHVARTLLERGVRVRALTRNPAQVAAEALAELGADIVTGDLNDPESLVPALDGVDGVFSVQDFKEAGYDGEVQQGRNLADLAKRMDIAHFVQSSVGSAREETSVPHFESKAEIEAHVEQLGLPATILRPVFFMQNWEAMRAQIFHGRLQQPLDIDTRLQQVNVEDLAVFVALAFENPDEWIGRSVDIAGDELSMRETTQVFSEITGVPVHYERVPWEEFEATAGPEMTRMYQWFEEVGYEAEIESLRRIHPQLSGLRAYLEVHGWGQGDHRNVPTGGKSAGTRSSDGRRLGTMHSLETPDPRIGSREPLERGRERRRST